MAKGYGKMIFPEGWVILIIIFGFGYLLSRKHSIQALVEYVWFNDGQLFNKEKADIENRKNKRWE